MDENPFWHSGFTHVSTCVAKLLVSLLGGSQIYQYIMVPIPARTWLDETYDETWIESLMDLGPGPKA